MVKKFGDPKTTLASNGKIGLKKYQERLDLIKGQIRIRIKQLISKITSF
jgi:signal transduction histidine kinase